MLARSGTRGRPCRLGLLVAALLALGASPGRTPRPMLDLNPKKPALHANDGFRSVLFWRVRVEDRTGEIAGLNPRLVVGPPGSAERLKSGRVVSMDFSEYQATHYTASAVRGEWQRSGSTAVFDGLYAVEARPGSYELFAFSLDREREGIGDSAAVIPLAPGPCTVGSEQLLYLGELRVTVEGPEPKSDLFRLLLEPAPGDLAAMTQRDLESLRTLFPDILKLLPREPGTGCSVFATVRSTTALTD
jgi:hypothetical protein